MIKLQFIFLVLFTFIFSIFVNCVGEPRGVGIHGAIWGAILSGSGKKRQSMFECRRKITKTTKNCSPNVATENEISNYLANQRRAKFRFKSILYCRVSA